jgi:hypothetical protein
MVSRYKRHHTIGFLGLFFPPQRPKAARCIFVPEEGPYHDDIFDEAMWYGASYESYGHHHNAHMKHKKQLKTMSSDFFIFS